MTKLSREIRTATNDIVRMIDLALGTQLEKEGREYLEAVKSLAESLLNIIENLGDPAGNSAAKTTASPDPAANKGLRILVAEDNVVNQKLAVRLLQKMGHEAIVAVNGQEAVAASEKEDFDLILMDIQMPLMDGFEATAAIRQRENREGRSIPIVALTAHATAGHLEKCLAAGMDGYVAKPIKKKQLLAEITRLLPQREAEQPVTS